MFGLSSRVAACSCALALLVLPALAQQGALDVTFKESEMPGAPSGAKARLYSTSKALVIGLDHYADKAWPKLSLAISDAKAVAQALTAKGFAVTLATDLNSDELDRTFRDFFINEGADPQARLFVWFAGHGHTIDGEGYLVPTDSPSPHASDVAFRRKALSLRRFGEYMREARSKHVLAVFDSCFAGTVFTVARAAPPRAITLSTALPVRQFISSGDADQAVSDNGAFRRLFIDAIEGREPEADANRDGYVTGSELGNFMFDRVTNYSEKGQTPRYGKLNAQGYDRGDFVFERGRLEAAASVAAVPPSSTNDLAARIWEGEARSSSNVKVLEAFARQFPDTVYAELATERAATLRRDAEAAAKAQADAERQRLAALEAQRREQAQAANPFKGRWATSASMCTRLPGYHQETPDRQIQFGTGMAQYRVAYLHEFSCKYARVEPRSDAMVFSAACERGIAPRINRGDIEVEYRNGQMSGVGPDGFRFKLIDCATVSR